MAATRSSSSGSSITILAKPCSMASAISSSDLLLPCSTRRRPGTPAARAIFISPIVQVSTKHAGLGDQSHDFFGQERLAGKAHVRSGGVECFGGSAHEVP